MDEGNGSEGYDYVVYQGAESMHEGAHSQQPLALALDPAAQSDPVKPKRIHIAAACHFCKGRKMRCDGNRPPCGNCSARGLTCQFPAVIRTRGPNKPKSPSDGPRKPRAGPGFRRVVPPPQQWIPTDPSLDNDPAALAAAAAAHAHALAAGDPSIAPELQDAKPQSPPRRKRRRATVEDAPAEDGGEGGEDDEDGDESGAGVDADGQPKKRRYVRKRATMACHPCRSRKMKCDEQQPICAQCARRQLQCQYDEHVRRRGPSKKKKELQAQEAAVAAEVQKAYMLLDAQGQLIHPQFALAHALEAHAAQMETPQEHEHHPLPPQPAVIWS